MCSLLVTIAWRASTHSAGTPAEVNAAATIREDSSSPIGGHDVERAWRHFSQDRECFDDVGERVELGVDLREQRVERSAADESASGDDVPFANQLRPGQRLRYLRRAG